MRDADTRLLNEKKRVLPKGNPNKKKETHHRASRVAPFSPPDDAQKRSTIDSHRSRHTRRRDDARARAFLPSRALDRAPFSTSSLRSSSLHPERERARESPKNTAKRTRKKKKKRRRVGQLATFARRHNHLLSRGRTQTDEKTTAVRALEKTPRCSRERKRKSHRVPFFRFYKQNVKTVSPQTKKAKKLCKAGLKFRVV